ncbi:dicarboxylate/amino acid:cation symporter [Novosphingobium album (ex Liu et al. 2023)]|uniref:Dicarboxylate/amino acid:cation symporter n=1 Tax=Novosphingobium album (ex Liu et al. 2023) TaxID=3031130 RepID=A0ABT5WNA2_9SPHN|nr:dicarboxylate/amino acid:cation symporter [Novosphingobium album (ex Liu et al. 2023)]MDE8651206.1 dicarboxylate/amino acid:cation symporter [Novosphingobium album (ex Liu et al. 2023)]
MFSTLTSNRWSDLSSHISVLAGFAVGVGGGLIVNLTIGRTAWVVGFMANVTRPIENLFLRLLFVLVLPLLFSALVTSIAGLRDVKAFRRMGGLMLGFILAASALATLIGLATVNLFQPGEGIDPVTAEALLNSAGRAGDIVVRDTHPTILGTIVQLVPANIVSAASQNNLLGIIFFALLFGVGLMLVRTEGSKQLLMVIEGLFDVGVWLIGIVIRLAPIAVACFMFDLTVMFGWTLLAHLSAYVGTVLLAFALHIGIVFSSFVWIVGGMRPLVFFKAVQEAAFIAFSTSSSNATLPTALKVAQENLGVPSQVARFVLGICTVANQNGTAIYAAVTILFLAQFFGVNLGPTQQLTVFAMCMLSGIGTVGIPAGALPLVSAALGIIGVPPEGIGLVIGVDRLLDMCRTNLNVVGDLAIAVAISRQEDVRATVVENA